MPSSTVVVAVSVGYLVLCLVLGILPGKNASESAQGYVAGDRTLGLVLMYFITGATIFSAFAFLGGPGWTYKRGASAFYILGYGALGLVPLYFLGPRAARVGRKLGFVTQAQMMAVRYDSRPLAGLMAFISVVAFVPYLAIQMKGAGFVLETVTGGTVPAWAGALAVYAVVTIYVLKSGVLGVGWTNTFQGIFMMVLAWGLGLYLPGKLYGGIGPLFERLAQERPELILPPGLAAGGTPWPGAEYASAVIISIVGFSMWPHLFMKVFTAKSERTIQHTVLLYPTFQIFLVPLFIIGYCGVFFPSAPPRPDQILPHILMNTEIPSLVVGFFCAGALAASMSSGDAMAHAAASIAVRDGFVTAGNKNLSGGTERRIIQAVVLFVMIAAYGVAMAYQGSLVILLLTTYGAVVQFAPGIVSALYLPKVRGRSVIAGMVAGSLTTLVLVVDPSLRPWPAHAGAYGLVVNLIVLGALQLTVKSATEAAERFVHAAKDESASGESLA